MTPTDKPPPKHIMSNIPWGLILQTTVIMIGGAFGWAKLEANQQEMRRQFDAHIADNGRDHETYVLKEVWAVRNSFVDSSLGELKTGQKEMDKKLDTILMELRRR